MCLLKLMLMVCLSLPMNSTVTLLAVFQQLDRCPGPPREGAGAATFPGPPT